MSSTASETKNGKRPEAVTRQTLANRIAADTELSVRQATEVVDQIIEEVTQALADGEDVMITGFGKFVTLEKKSRLGRNPRTKEPLTIAPRRVLKFRSSPLLTQELTKARLSGLR